PVPAARVPPPRGPFPRSWKLRDARTDESGRFVLRGLQRRFEPLFGSISKPGFAVKSIRSEDPPEDARFVLHRSPLLRIRVASQDASNLAEPDEFWIEWSRKW